MFRTTFKVTSQKALTKATAKQLNTHSFELDGPFETNQNFSLSCQDIFGRFSITSPALDLSAVSFAACHS